MAMQKSNVIKRLDLKSFNTQDLLALKLRISKEIKSRKPKKRRKSPENKKRNYKVYTLVCKNGKFYVGMTAQKVESRYEQHVSCKGAKWTKLHKPIGIEAVIQLGYTDELSALAKENEITREVIGKYGGENVRGGDLCYVDQSLMDKRLLRISKKLSKSAENERAYQEELARELNWI